MEMRGLRPAQFGKARTECAPSHGSRRRRSVSPPYQPWHISHGPRRRRRGSPPYRTVACVSTGHDGGEGSRRPIIRWGAFPRGTTARTEARPPAAMACFSTGNNGAHGGAPSRAFPRCAIGVGNRLNLVGLAVGGQDSEQVVDHEGTRAAGDDVGHDAGVEQSG